MAKSVAYKQHYPKEYGPTLTRRDRIPGLTPYWTGAFDEVRSVPVEAFGSRSSADTRGVCAWGPDNRTRVRVPAFPSPNRKRTAMTSDKEPINESFETLESSVPSAPSEEERLKETLEQLARLSKQLEERKATTQALRDEVATLEGEVHHARMERDILLKCAEIIKSRPRRRS